MKPHVEPFQEGDEVVKGDERGRIVMVANRSTGELFPLVWIQHGPRKHQREYPRLGWTVELDWSTDGPRAQCAECEREFRRPVPEADGVREVFCQSCTKAMERANRGRARHAGSLGEAARARDWNATLRR